MEKKIFIHSLIFPTAFVFTIWMVEIFEQITGISLVNFGVYPLHAKGLSGILFSPFIHSDFNHLISNSIPFFILSFMLVYYYRRISYRIFFLMYILAGFCVWVFGREAWHIGASGVVYALAAFHFISGIIRNDVRLLTLSVVVVFLYGGLIWGMFPINPEVSWEGHLWGAISGVIMAIVYRKYIIRRDKFDWEEEEEDEDEEENTDDQAENENSVEIKNSKEKDKKEIKANNQFSSGNNTNHTGQY